MVTLKQVAKHCGVSVETASAILNTKRAGLFRPEMREKVQKAATELGYHPNQIARMLRGAENTTLGIIAGYHSGYPNLHTYTLINAAGTEAQKAGYSTIFSFNRGDQGVSEGVLRNMLAERVAGLLLFSINGFDPVKRLPLNAPPCAGVCCTGFSGPNQINVDGTGGVVVLVQKAWDLGHRSFAMLTPDLRWNQSKLDGVGRVLSSFEAEWSQDRIFVADAPGKIASAVKAAMALTPRPSCLICSNDQIAVQTINHLQANGVHVPNEVSVTGFDGSWVGEMSGVAVTTVQQPYEEIGRKAIERILAQIKNPEKSTEPLLLETTLKMGDSLGAPPAEAGEI